MSNISQIDKKAVEKKAALIFIELMQNDSGRSLSFVQAQDVPDILCKDNRTGEIIGLEITLLEDIEGQIPYFLTKQPPPTSPTTGLVNVSSFPDVVEILRLRLEEKVKNDYGIKTALILVQTSPVWDVRVWRSSDLDQQWMALLALAKERFSFGVWIITTDNCQDIPVDTLFCLVQPVQN